MARNIETEIIIDASADTVWEVLADFDRVAEWNEFIRHIEGGPRVGDRLEVELWVGDRDPMTFRPRLLAYDPGRELRWKGRLVIPGLFDGEHAFVIEPVGEDQVRFVHRERFTGILVPLLLGKMKADIERSFDGFNRALKARAEARASRQRTVS